MNCPSCGRPLASGAKKCVYCGGGGAARPREVLAVPPGSTRKPKTAIPWGKILMVLIVVGAVAAAFLHPELNAAIRGLLSRF